MKFSALLAPSVFALVPFFGCSGETTSSGPSDPEKQATACDDAASAICAKITECAAIAGLSLDQAACKAFGDQCKATVFGKNTGVTPEGVTKCAAAFRAESCEGFHLDTTPTECLFSGKVASGSACTRDGDCASRLCAGESASACGTCAVKKLAEGDQCSIDKYGKDECDNSLDCFGGKCTRRVGEGADCTAAPCRGDLVCSQGKCSTGAALGDACDNDGKSAPRCNTRAGLYCGFTSKKCEQATIVNLGEQCGALGTAPNYHYGACNLGAFCSGFNPPSALVGTCVARRGYLGACESGGECTIGLDCLNGTCGQKVLDACP